jgi:hypothetical protein
MDHDGTGTHDGKQRKKLSYRVSLPSHDLHILMVGPTHLTKPLATALLQVTSEPTTTNNGDTSNDDDDDDDDDAISALRRLYPPPAFRKRCIHLCHSLDKFSCDVRMDHIVFVSQHANDPTTIRLPPPPSSTTTMSTTTTKPPPASHDDNIQQPPPPTLLPYVDLHEDYIWMQRVSMVYVLDPKVIPTRTIATKRRGNKKTIPCFFVRENEWNHSMARLLLQRAHIGARDMGVSPMIFGTYA